MAILEDIIKRFAHAQYREPLKELYRVLNERDGLWDQSLITYPVTHSGAHVERVAASLVRLHEALPEDKRLSPERRSLLLAAAMIHDVGMSRLRHLAPSSREAREARRRHSRPDVLEELAGELLLNSGFQVTDAAAVIAIAAAHSLDDQNTVEEKIGQALIDKVADGKQTELAIRLLGLADYLDVGRERVVKNSDKTDWDEEQRAHFRKHSVLARPDCVNGVFALFLEKRGSVRPKPDDLCVLHAAREDLKTHLRNINTLLGVDWYLKPLDAGYFGEVVPLSSASGLFLRELEAAKRRVGRNAPIRIDMMGHSLFQRFVSDRGKLNESLLALLRDTHTQMRVLLLDPNSENQQACEVFDGQHQSDSQSEAGRSILPLFDQCGEKVDVGDIGRTLDAIDRNWSNQHIRGALEVRSTCRLMYASIVRFEDRMIVTPYIASGLFNQSGGILLTEESPVFRAYEAEFQSIWNHRWETRLLRHVSNDVGEVAAAITRIVKDDAEQVRGVPGFSYAQRILHRSERMQRIFEHAASSAETRPPMVPPTEVEIQPTSECELRCHHCIGAHLNSSQTIARSFLDTNDFSWLDDMLAWSEFGLGIERFRISGLHGDPLASPARPFTRGAIKRIKNAGREVVLFTNGLALKDGDTLADVLEADFLHISLDASTPQTFERVKGVDAFEIVVEGARSAKKTATKLGKSTKIGFGFVVTQENYHEAHEAVAVAARQGMDFVRFRRDIHRPDALGWRAWSKACDEIKSLHKQGSSISSPELYIMDLPKRHWASRPDKCWMQHYCVTVGPDALAYPCDHLSGMQAHAFGSLRTTSFAEIMRQIWQNGRLTRVCSDCWQCPPFNSRGNYVLDQMNVLFGRYGWMRLKQGLPTTPR